MFKEFDANKCSTCGGVGHVIKPLYTFGFEFIPCNCEYTEKAKRESEQAMKELQRKLDEWKEKEIKGGEGAPC